MKKKIGFIGVGIMGKSIVRNLMRAGYEVVIYSRTKEKTLDVIEEGAVWRASVAECVKDADVIFTMVGYPQDVEEVYFGEKGIIACAPKGAYLIDMTTTSPKISKRIAQEAKAAGMHALDAPVSGGDAGARNATLSIMVGGEKEDFDTCLPLFNVIGTTVIYEGEAGNGQHTKMANQIALGGCLSGVCEAITYATSVGLDVQTMLDSISQGAAGSWQMTNMGPRMAKGDFAPGFFIKHYIKDMKIAVEEAADAGAELHILQKILEMYSCLEVEGCGDEGTQALLKYYERKK